MADNIDITPGAGATVATDQVGGRHYQRVKLTDGAEGSENHASVRADGTQEVSLSDIDGGVVRDPGGSHPSDLAGPRHRQDARVAGRHRGRYDVGVTHCHHGEHGHVHDAVERRDAFGTC